MATEDRTLTRRQKENHRDSIRVGRLLQILQDNAEGKLKDSDGKPYELSPGRIKSIQIALGKVLADQTKVETEDVTDPPSLKEIRGALVDMIAKDPSLAEEAAKVRSSGDSENVIPLSG